MINKIILLAVLPAYLTYTVPAGLVPVPKERVFITPHGIYVSLNGKSEQVDGIIYKYGRYWVHGFAKDKPFKNQSQPIHPHKKMTI